MLISFLRRTALALFGVVLFFVFLEGGLRLGGFISSSMQARENLQSIKQKGTYRILCVGESTTDRQYPQPLERILNRKNIGMHFGVIDEGKPAVNTFAILGKLESYLAKYCPDMVIAMMGVNDQGVKYYQDISESQTWIFQHSRAYQFGRILYMQLIKKLQKNDVYGSDRADLRRKSERKEIITTIKREDLSSEVSIVKAAGFPEKTDGLANDNDSVPLKSGRLYLAQGKSLEAEDSFKKAIEMNPHKESASIELGRLYLEQGKYPQAEDLFKRALELNPQSAPAYFELGRLYRFQSKFQKVEDSFRKTIEISPNSDNAYVELGHLYQMQGEFSRAEDSFRRSAEINPKNDQAYFEWGKLCLEHGEFSQAEDLFKKVIELNPKNHQAYFELGWLYRLQGEFPKAVNLFKKAMEFYPNNERALGATASLYEEIGKPELAREYSKKADRFRLNDNIAVTVNNYRRLKTILGRKGIKLVCVQYPMRSIEPLKRIFEKDKDVIFVDNQRVFREALKRSSYKEYFRDMFAGDFGHCTQKGNELLAQNIADVILMEVFSK